MISSAIQSFSNMWPFSCCKRICLSPEEIRFKRAGIPESSVRAMFQVRKMTQMLSETHYVFSHANNPHYLPLYLLYTRLYQCLKTAEKIQDFVFLSSPFGVFNVFLSSPFEVFNPIQRPPVPRSGYDASRDSNRLISADAFHMSTEEVESALDMSRFHRWTRKVEDTSNPIKFFMRELDKWKIDPVLKDQFKVRFLKIMQKPLQNKPMGRDPLFWGIAVPKNKFFEIGYFAHHHGLICHCHTLEPHFVLQQLQRGIPSSCKGMREGRVPQFRLYPEKLTPENNVITQIFSDFTPAELVELRAETSHLAQDICRAIKQQEINFNPIEDNKKN